MTTPRPNPLVVDVWADVICPWCYLGEHRLQQAVEQSGVPVELRPRAFQLDPAAPRTVGTAVDYLSAKYGTTREQAAAMESEMAQRAEGDGLVYSPEHLVSNTADMLRLVQLGREHGVGWQYLRAVQDELFGGNAAIFEAEELVRVGVGLGLAEQQIRDVLAGDRFADVVAADQQEAVRLGARGVPFVVVDGRLGVPGAVSVEQYRLVIEEAAQPAAPPGSGAPPRSS